MLKAKHIAQAISKAAQSGADPKQLAESVEKFLKQKGATKLMSKLLLELDKISKQEIRKRPTLKVANEKSLSSAQKELNIDPQKTNIEFDNTLIGGYIYKDKSKMIINDYKHHLLDLYKKIISSI